MACRIALQQDVDLANGLQDVPNPHGAWRATFAALILVGCFYSFSLWCLVLGTGSGSVVETITALSGPTNFLYTLSDRDTSPHLTMLLRGMFIISIYAGLIAFHNSSARYFHAMGREGLLAARLGCTHPQHKSPQIASLLLTAICVVVVGAFAVAKADPVLTMFSWLSNLATVGVLFLMVTTAIAVVKFFLRNPDGQLLRYGTARTFLMPLQACTGLSLVLVLAVANFHVLTGAGRTLSMMLIALVPVAALLGGLAANHLRRVNPMKFEKLGQDRC